MFLVLEKKCVLQRKHKLTYVVGVGVFARRNPLLAVQRGSKQLAQIPLSWLPGPDHLVQAAHIMIQVMEKLAQETIFSLQPGNDICWEPAKGRVSEAEEVPDTGVSSFRVFLSASEKGRARRAAPTRATRSGMRCWPGRRASTRGCRASRRPRARPSTRRRRRRCPSPSPSQRRRSSGPFDEHARVVLVFVDFYSGNKFTFPPWNFPVRFPSKPRQEQPPQDGQVETQAPDEGEVESSDDEPGLHDIMSRQGSPVNIYGAW